MKFIIFPFLVLFSGSLYSAEYVETRIKNLIKEVNNPPGIELNRIKSGILVRVVWLDIPIFIYHRTKKDFQLLEEADETLLADPHDSNIGELIHSRYSSSVANVYAQLYKAGGEIAKKNKFRSIKKEYLVIGGLDPVSGCPVIYDTENEVRFYDRCSSRVYDSSGRLFKRSKEGKKIVKPFFNLPVFPSFMTSKNKMLFGVKGGYEMLPNVSFDYAKIYNGQTPSQQLVTAAFYNDYESLLKSLKKGADVEYQGDKLPPPLIAAIIGSDIRSIEILLKKGAKQTKQAVSLAKLLKRDDVLALFFSKDIELKSSK